MKLVATSEPHLLQLMGWFPDARSCAVWAGPDFRYPFNEITFREDVRTELPSFSMVDDHRELLGFGQYYSRLGRCHLARLVVSPNHRGRSLGAVLIRELCQLGCSDLETDQCSLFVLADNAPALRLYSRVGFTQQPYPGQMPLAECIYMAASLEEVIAKTGTQ